MYHCTIISVLICVHEARCHEGTDQEGEDNPRHCFNVIDVAKISSVASVLTATEQCDCAAGIG